MKQKYKVKATCYDKRGRIISTGENSYTKTHPLQAYFAEKVGHPLRIYLHAEIDALVKSSGKKVHSIHVERAGQRLAKPCPVCMEAIKAFGVETISYSKEE